MTDKFSKRLGYHKPSETDIVVRHEAPYEFRGVLVDIAYECGFNSIGTFNRAFKDIVDMSPREFRSAEGTPLEVVKAG